MDVEKLVTKLELETKDFDKGIKASIKEIERFGKSVTQMRGVLEGLEKTQTRSSKQQHEMMKAVVSMSRTQLQEAKKLTAAMGSQTRETTRLNNGQKQSIAIANEAMNLAGRRLSQVRAQITAEEQLARAVANQAGALDTLKKKNDDTANSQEKLTGSSESYLQKLPGISQAIDLARNGFSKFQSYLKLNVSDFIDAAREAENYRVSLETVFGSSQKGAAAFTEISAFASQAPFSFEEIMGAAKKVSPVLQENNESLKEWMPIMGDIAAVSGLTLEEVGSNMVKLMNEGTAGSTLFQQKGINTLLGFLPNVSYSGKESVEIIKKAAHSSTSVLSGLTKRLSLTWDGQITMLKNKWFDFRRELMDSELFDFLKACLHQLNSYFDKNNGMKSFAQSMGSAITKVLKTVLKSFLVFKYSFEDFIAENKGYFKYFIENPRKSILFGVKNPDKQGKTESRFEKATARKKGSNARGRFRRHKGIGKVKGVKGGRNKTEIAPPPAQKPNPEEGKKLTAEEKAEQTIAEIVETQKKPGFNLELIPGLSDKASSSVSKLTSEIDRLKKSQAEAGTQGVAAIHARISAMKSELGITSKRYEAYADLGALQKEQAAKIKELEKEAPERKSFKSDEAFNTATDEYEKKRERLFADNKNAAKKLADDYGLTLQQLVDQSAQARALDTLEKLEKGKFVNQETLKVKKMLASVENEQLRSSMTPYQQKVEQVKLDHERIKKSLGGEYKGNLKESLDKWKQTSLETLKINRNLEQARKQRSLLDQKGAIGKTGIELERYNLEREYHNADMDAGTDFEASEAAHKTYLLKLGLLNAKTKQSWKETMDALSTENQRFGSSEFSAPVFSYFDQLAAKKKELGEGSDGSQLGKYKKELLNLSGKQVRSAAAGAGTVDAWMGRSAMQATIEDDKNARIAGLNTNDPADLAKIQAITAESDKMKENLTENFNLGMISGGLKTQLDSMAGAFSDFFMTIQEDGEFAFDKLIGSLMRQLQIQAASMLSQFLMQAAFHGIMQFVDDSVASDHAGKAVAALQGAAIMGSFVAGSALAGMAHDGIDEVPGLNGKNEGTWLLEKGERVVDKRTNADLKSYLSDGGGKGNVNVDITINDPKDKDSVLEAMPRLRQMIIDTVGSNIASNGSINKTIKAYT